MDVEQGYENPTNITREELYKQVWLAPMTRRENRYVRRGISLFETFVRILKQLRRSSIQ